jgi:DNA/RNA endonuclease YhcR with UshA esterase domain
MTRRLLLTTLFLTLGPTVRLAHAQQAVIRDSEAASYIGKTVTVAGMVASVHVARSGITFLNFSEAYPNQTFTAVIFQAASSRFPNAQQWEGQRVHVTGKVQLYRGKPEIVLSESSQLVPAP